MPFPYVYSADGIFMVFCFGAASFWKHVSDISLRVEAFSVGDKCDTVTVSTRLFLICRLKRRNFCW
jgi:hypothetical protein